MRLLVLLSLLFIQGGAINKQPPDIVRTPRELCTEVSFEVQESVKFGLLTQEQADNIIERCFRIYVGGS